MAQYYIPNTRTIWRISQVCAVTRRRSIVNLYRAALKEERVQHLLGERPNRGIIALALLAGFCVPLSASAEIFKCVARDGSPLYQNFPCQFDSIGWVPSSMDIAKAAAKPGDATQSKSKSTSVPVASSKTANVKEPEVGMTADEVRALLGAPEEMVDDEPAEGGRVSLWRYADGRFVQFDHKHHVLEIRR
jgi:hypothetical protein